MRPRLAPLLSSILLVTVAAGAATAAMRDDPQVRVASADQETARALVLKTADLPDLNIAGAWKGGAVKPGVEGFACPGYTQSDLVVTGAASSSFLLGNRWAGIDSDVWVLQTDEMVQLDRRRLSPGQELRCVRSSYDNEPASFRLVSVSRLTGFAELAAHASAIRVVYDLTVEGKAQRLFHDYITLYKGRFEISLFLGTGYEVHDAARSAEIFLARLLLGRAVAAAIRNPAAFPDPAGDAGTAPDLTGLTLTSQGGNQFVLDVRWAGGGDLPEGIIVGLDTDLKPATGGLNGAEYLIELDPTTMITFDQATPTTKTGGVHPSFFRWNGTRYVSISLGMTLASAGKGAARVFFCLCDIGELRSFNAFAHSETRVGSDTDLLPDAGPGRVDLPVVHSVLSVRASAIAGQPFKLTVQGIRLVDERCPVVAPQKATCSATLAGTALSLSGRCRWLLPLDARGKQLAVSYKVVYKGATTTFDGSYTIG